MFKSVHQRVECDKSYTPTTNLYNDTADKHTILFMCKECGLCTKSTHTNRSVCKECGLCTKNTQTNRFVCKECGLCTKSEFDLKNHQKVHTGEKRFECTKCQCMFTTKWNRIQHERTVHYGLKCYKCHNCDYKSDKKYNIKRHQKSIHNDK